MNKLMNRIGERYGKLVIIKELDKKDFHRQWLCQCDCGNTHIVSSRHWKEVRSCGCLRKTPKQTKAHIKLRTVYKDMKARCYNKNSVSYKNYGGRGIIMCEEWKNDFMSFYNWAIQNGYDENKTRKEQSIDRINVNGNYDPNNCRWISMRQQANNTRKNTFLKYKNTIKTMAQWSRILKINYKTFCNFVNSKRKYKRKILKKVLQYDLQGNFIKEYNSIEEASKYTNLSHSTISRFIRGEIKKPKKFKWELREGE